MTIGPLKPKTSFSKIDFLCNTSFDHPLQCTIDSGTTNVLIILFNMIKKIICTEVPLLAEKDTEDQFPFTGTLTSNWLKRLNVRKSIHRKAKGKNPLRLSSFESD